MSVLRTKREAANLTREQVAVATSISVFRIGRFEREEQVPEYHEARAIAQYFHCPMEDFDFQKKEPAHA